MKTLNDYLKTQPPKARAKLNLLRKVIKQALPQAKEVISYSMPAFKEQKVIVWYASFKNHYSIFVRPKVLQKFKKELKAYTTTKSAIHFQYDKHLPVQLIAKIVKSAAKENLKN